MAGLPQAGMYSCGNYQEVYSWGRAAFQRWTKGTSLAALRAAELKLHTPAATACLVTIKGYKVYAKMSPGSSWHRWLLASLAQLHQAVAAAPAGDPYPIPDVQFVLSVSDWPKGRINSTEEDPLPVFSISSTSEVWDIPVPSPNFLVDERGIEYLRVEYRGISSRIPWQERIELAFWRGQMQCPSDRPCDDCPRYNVWRKSQADARMQVDFTGLGRCGTEVTWEPREPPKSPLIPMSQHAYWKYLIHTGGQTYSYRLYKILGSGSTVLIEDSKYREWYHVGLEPYKHFMPFACYSAGLCNVSEAITYLQDHPSEAHAMAQASTKFAHRFLTYPGVFCYWRGILREYAMHMESAWRRSLSVRGHYLAETILKEAEFV